MRVPVRKNRKTVGRFPFFEIDRWDVENALGSNYHAYVLRCADWVAAVALTVVGFDFAWPVRNPLISVRDQNLPTLDMFETPFRYSAPTSGAW